jgi:cbb3-type cytochrome oxidase subunit 3
MKSEVLKNFHLPWLSVTAELLFFGLFIGVLFYVISKRNQNTFKEDANLPFQEGNKYE